MSPCGRRQYFTFFFCLNICRALSQWPFRGQRSSRNRKAMDCVVTSDDLLSEAQVFSCGLWIGCGSEGEPRLPQPQGSQSGLALFFCGSRVSDLSTRSSTWTLSDVHPASADPQMIADHTLLLHFTFPEPSCRRESRS
ncbi:unnamed protein product [Pleuronectes platessa]|uniref:Secreted protein n=1 Tax=Pleuronectes platessa TaxID=8262 RepID=A0A9N7Y5V2_PLEPL|nr:unnamed protein product [Pleuronectes platessa]